MEQGARRKKIALFVLFAVKITIMTQNDLINAHHYIESLDMDEQTKEVCRGIMLGKYWAITFKNRGRDITQIPTKTLIDQIISESNPNLSA